MEDAANASRGPTPTAPSHYYPAVIEACSTTTATASAVTRVHCTPGLVARREAALRAYLKLAVEQGLRPRDGAWDVPLRAPAPFGLSTLYSWQGAAVLEAAGKREETCT